MPTKKITSFVCVILTVALVWSSIGVGVLSAPAKAAQESALLDIPDNNLETSEGQTSDEPLSDAQKPTFETSATVGDNRPNSKDGWYYEPSAMWGNWSYRDAHNVPAVGYTGSGVTVAVADTGIDFVAQNLAGKYMTVTNTTSPYYGWPVAFDALSLPSYLLSREARYGSGGIANTTQNGTGPFDIDHEIKVDGKKDFLANELLGTDAYDDIKTPGTATGLEFDLTELWATRDDQFWYAGTKTLQAGINRTFAFSFDFDGPVSGSIEDPKGNLLDFEASHSAPIEQVAFEPNNGWVASCAAAGSGDAITNGYETNSVKVWNQDGVLLHALPNEQYPINSVIWSPTGNLLAYQSSTDVVIYETNTWTESRRITHSLTPAPNNRETMDFSPDGTMLIVGSLVNSNEFLAINVLNGTIAKPSIANTPSSVAYSPDGSMIAFGLTGGIIQILDSATYVEVMNFIAPGLVDTDSTSIETLAWSPDGTKIATGRNSVGLVDIWDLVSGNNRMHWGGQNHVIENLQFTSGETPPIDRLFIRGVPDEGGPGSYMLGDDVVDSYLQLSPTMANGGNHSWGMRVWTKTAAEVETELTSGSADAIVYRDIDGEGMQVGTWTPPLTALDPTDSVVVRIYQGRDEAFPTTLVGTFTSQPINATQLINTTWNVNYFTRRSSVPGSLQTRMTGHGSTSSVNAISWTATNIVSGATDGKLIFWNPTTFAMFSSRNSKSNSPIFSFALNGGDAFVGTEDCSVRKYPSTWASYTPFVAHKPDIMIYIRYEREYYTYGVGGQKLDIFDKIEEPIVYRWDGSQWFETNMTNIFGKAFYKGNLAGEWTAHGFLEIGLPRNFTAWPNQNDVFINSFICGDNASRPQDTVPSDCNVPSEAGKMVDWAGSQVTTLSSWAKLSIPKVTVNASAIPSATGIYHFGYHPSTALNELYGSLVPIIVSESTTEGTWDKVYVDMNQDYVIDSEDRCVYKGAPELYLDMMKLNGTSAAIPGQDGIPDISGGLLYFIGDGETKLPYSDRMSEILIDSGDQLTPFSTENPMPIPRNGEIVAFYGELDFDVYDGVMETHGTQMASAIAGEGLNIGEYGPVEGVSPDVTFLPISNAHYAMDYALYFAVEGYDGVPNTGDEAQIVSLGQYFTGYGSGLDETTQLVEFLVKSTDSKTVFISPAGNDGSGYGTVAAPCGVNTLVVGFAEDNTFISSGGDVHHQGVVSELSSRGPTAAGLSKPDVIALGMGDVDMPLGASGSLATAVGGKSQTVLWKSSDLASAVTTGVMALIFEAYKDTHGTFPSTQTAMNIIRSSAKDLGYDGLTQGAGFVDALAAVQLATNQNGLMASAPKTSFGNTFGLTYDSFINVLAPGESGTLPITLQNPTIADESAVVYDFDYMSRIDLQEFHQLVPSTSAGYRGEITNMVPLDAEVIKVTAQTNYSWTEVNVVENITFTDYKTFISEGGSFLMNLWDWVDAQSIGNPKHGIIDSGDGFSYLTGTEYGGVNSLICTLSNPHNGLSGKLVIEIAADADNSLKKNCVWKISVESFASTPMDWITLSKTSANIASGGNDTVNVNVNVPANAQAGTYAGSFVASYDTKPVYWNNTIPYNAMPEDEYFTTTLESTYWDDGNLGNYWDDYAVKYPAATNDWVTWDTPYQFNTPGKMDNYPLFNMTDTYSNARISADPFVIANNDGFEGCMNVTGGNGTVGNPWLIENLDIDGSAFSQPGISISNTDAYFIIRNCAVHDTMGDNSGILLNNVKNGVLVNSESYLNVVNGISIIGSSNIILENVSAHNSTGYGNGIYIESSSNITISDADIATNFITGTYITLSNNITVTGSRFHDQNDDAGNPGFTIGLALENSNYCTVTGNEFYSDFWGVYLYASTHNEISSNMFNGFDWQSFFKNSIYLDSSGPPAQYNVISGNDFIDCTAGHAFDDDPGTTNVWDGNHWAEYTDVDVAPPIGIWDNPYIGIDADWDGIGDLADNAPWVNPVAMPKTYHIPRSTITIIGNSSFNLTNGVTGGNGSADNPFIINGWEIDTTGEAYGILVQDTTLHFVIMNCLIFGNTTGNGIMISNAPNGVVRSNELHTLSNAIYVEDTTEFMISYNDIQVGGMGIYLLNSDNGTILFNVVNGGIYGIYLDDSHSCELLLNYITGTLQAGIYIMKSDWNVVENNNITGNAGNGTLLQQSNNCTIFLNTLVSNVYGIYLANATGFNRIHHNNLLGNIIQAYDDFVGDTLTGFELFSEFGIPADYLSTYDVRFCNITRNGVNLTAWVDYTVDNDTGLITFTPVQTGQSGGAEISIRAVFYKEDSLSLINLPNTRLTDGPVSLTLFVTKLNGTVESVTVNYVLYRKVGTIELETPFRILRDITSIRIYANYRYYNRTSIVPLTLNVLAAESADFTFGNKSATETPNIMPVWGVRAGQGASLQSGDRRYFYVRVPNQGRFGITELANFYLYTELSWLLNQSDVNVIIYGKGQIPISSNTAPYTMAKLGGSDEVADFSFLTATNGPKDILVTPFNHEILTICVSSKTFNGSGESITAFEGRGGWIKLSDNNPKAWTNDLVGHLEVSFQSSVELETGIFASIVGPAQGSKSTEEIYQDDLTLYDLSTLEGWLTMNAVAGFTKVFTVKNALSWDVRIIGHPECPDLDLAVFLDGLNGQPIDGIAQWQEIITKRDIQFDAYMSSYGSGTYAYCADADADEALKFISPPDGDYIVKVLGYTVNSAPGYFDLDVKSIFAGVEGYKLEHVETDFEDEIALSGNYLNQSMVKSFEVRTFNVLWTFPEETEDAVYGGIFVFGVPESQKLIVFSIDIVLDRESPLIKPTSTGPGSIVSTSTPTISAMLEDLSRGELDRKTVRVVFDGTLITDIATVSITETENSATMRGYWTGDIIYKPLGPLSEGGHFIQIEAGDKAGNICTMSWGFTVDTTDPVLTLTDPREEIYTNSAQHRIDGLTEANTVVSAIGVPAVVRQRIDNTFSIDLELEDGSNIVSIKSIDQAGNIYEVTRTVILDTDAPTFKRVVALDGSTTNKRMTGIYGEMSESGTLQINGIPIIVNSDGTFRHESIHLIEGQNTQVLAFTDLAGNLAYNYLNVTLDTAPPVLTMAGIDKTVYSDVLNITGRTEAGVASLTVNGKLVSVDASGNFQQGLRLSPGTNTIVVESKDRAGNSVQEILTVNYVTDSGGTNWAAIGVMVALMFVGFMLGLFLGPMIFGGKKDDVPVEEVPPMDEEISDEDLPAPDDMESIPEEDLPTEDVPPLDEEMIGDAADVSEDMEPIPAEESLPEELPETTSETESEVIPEETPAAEPEISAEPEDPRIAKLRAAYDSGKISKELYEKNLVKFKGQ
ncbi:MAG: right-handed parallel beta-helix repeat-containing protein [Candidatus Thermoplasmatota archaeon]|nr:right-handed parallel beta-helix repeat-containing protein [Candidatus Thermoplasmatota archaeon]MBU4591985.1 right-handed parallel beta-helix repeat-containing protein [Candidatus Thermoplasmatota archaeon]